MHAEHHIMILIQYPGTGFAQTKTFTTDLNHLLPDNSGDVGIEWLFKTGMIKVMNPLVVCGSNNNKIVASDYIQVSL